MVLSFFAGKERLTSSEIASALGLSTRMVRVLLKKWVEDGWLIVADQSNRGRAYVLSAIYRQSDDGIGKKHRGKEDWMAGSSPAMTKTKQKHCNICNSHVSEEIRIIEVKQFLFTTNSS